MKIDNLREVLAQASEEESRQIFQEAICKMARLAFFEAMEAEVTSLCGRKHYPYEARDYQRAGSDTISKLKNLARLLNYVRFLSGTNGA